MSNRDITIIIMISACVVIGGYDIILATNSIKGDTYSEIIKKAAWSLPVIPWFMGLLTAHWFWTGQKYVNSYTLGAGVLALLVIQTLPIFSSVHPMISVIIGFITGRVLWAQGHA